ncbi:choice-of-anchor Q domain-containing protein [Pseudomonas sp. F(2018)]|uniref:choice-of-anchor Q domain-containing protein n=1 Tax=Pseudomonas sp. F(2018) TaxID=2502240 RepID=UPI0010F6F479|nr:choice-of-anchor Q domain-containing protein [Pseudomonas sp. F(2018)]
MRYSISALAYASVLALSDAVLAQDLRVNRFNDEFDGICDTHCSLRDAVTASNLLGGDNRILLPVGIYTLALPPDYGEEGEVYDEDQNLNGDLDVLAGSLTLVGTDSRDSIIDGGAVDRLFEVEAGAALTVLNLTLRNGQTSEDGGAIENRGQLTVRHSLLTQNRCRYPWGGEQSGGAIFSSGQLEVYASRFESNYVLTGDSGGAFGGAIFSSGTLKVRDTLFVDNGVSTDDVTGIGGALFNTGAASVIRASFVNNRGDGQGAAIRNDGDGSLTLANVTVAKTPYAGLESFAAVANGSDYPMYPGTPSLTLIHATVADNLSVGVHNQGNLTVRNSLLIDNREGNCVNAGTLMSRGLLLGADASNCPATVYADDRSIYGKVLYALADNSAGLPIFSLPPASPALDAGVGACPALDQRGYPRPQDGDGDGVVGCDLGAYERGPRVH